MKLSGILFFIGFRKAFETTEWNFESKTIIEWISSLYRVCARARDVNKFLNPKTKEPLKVFYSSGIRGAKYIPVYNFPA